MKTLSYVILSLLVLNVYAQEECGLADDYSLQTQEFTSQISLCDQPNQASFFKNCLNSSKFYVKGWSGACFLDDRIEIYKYCSRTGFGVGGALGFSFCKYFSTELEGFYLYNSIKDLKFYHTKSGMHGSVKHYALLANLLLQYPLNCGITPFIGGGIGYGHERTELKGETFPRVHSERNSLAGQILGGISYSVFTYNEIITHLSLEGRYYIVSHHIGVGIVDLGIKIEF